MCGCGKRSTPRRVPTLRPSVGPRSIQGGTAAGPSPSELRALGMQEATSLVEARQMDAQRRRMEKIRRDTIRKKLGK